MTDKTYLTCAETAKLVRKALKAEFPKCKFYVRSSTYSGGASIDIHWIDGPTTKQVDSTVNPYKGAGFDGMVDLKFYYDTWLMPDGSAKIAKCNGSGCTFESWETEKPHPDAKRVSMGADFIHTNRHHSRELVERVGQMVHEEYGWDIPNIVDHNAYLTRTKTVPDASFEFDFENQERHRVFQNRLWETSAYDGPAPKAAPEPTSKPAPPPAPVPAVSEDWFLIGAT